MKNIYDLSLTELKSELEMLVEKMHQNLVKILAHEKRIELKELCLLGFEKPSAYLALLFLMARDENFSIEQEEFYGKLYVRKSTREERKLG